jgi:hypothetical protein
VRLGGKDVTKWEVAKKSFVDYLVIRQLMISVFSDRTLVWIIMKSIIRRGKVRDMFALKKQVLLNQFGQFSDVILP